MLMIFRSHLQIITFIFLASGMAAGQDTDSEVATLRELLGVPPSTVLQASKSSPLPIVLTVYVATGKDTKARGVFFQQINQWNKKEGAKYGTISLVQDISEANVILARYELRLNKNPFEGPAPVAMVPVRSYSYLIFREPDRLAVVWRMMLEGYRDPSSTQGVGSNLRRELFRRVKTRASNDKKKYGAP